MSGDSDDFPIRLVTNSMTFRLFEDGEVFVSRDSGSFQIVPDHEHRHLSVGRNNDWSWHVAFDVGSVAAFLPVEFESCGQENCFDGFPMLRSEFGHCRNYTSAKTLRCSTPLQAGGRHSLRMRRYPESSKTCRSVPCSEAEERKSFTASSTAWRANSGESPELATSMGIACATYWPSSRHICTVYSSFIESEHSDESPHEQGASMRAGSRREISAPVLEAEKFFSSSALQHAPSLRSYLGGVLLPKREKL
jgi:hypothetical protein